MKKIISVVMASLMLLSMAACSKSSDSGEDNSLKYVQDKGELVLGLDDTFTPMGFRDDNNNIVGFDIDLAQAVCDKLGVKLVTQPVSWEAKVNELNTKNVDCIWNGLSVTEEYEKQMTLSGSYMKNEIALVVKNDSDIATKEDMAGKKLALQAGSTAAQLLDEADNQEFKDSLAQVNPFDGYNLALLDLESGNSDAVLMDSIVANYAITEAGKDYKVLPESLLDDKYAVGFRKGDQELCDAVWNALKELKKDGTIAEISTKWFGSDVTTIE